MKIISPYLSICLLLITLSAVNKDVLACSCDSPSACEAFNRSKAVFIGRAIQASEKREDIYNGKLYVSYFGEVVFEVIEPFSGVSSRLVSVWASGGGMCFDYAFTLGETYLVYARESDNRKLWVSGCSRTCMLGPVTFSDSDSDSYRTYLQERQREYDDEIVFLRNVARGEIAGARIYGSVGAKLNSLRKFEKRSLKPLPNVAAKIEGEQQSLVVLTDGEGRYDVQSLQPGKYSITLTSPEGYVTSDEQDLKREFVLRDCGCGEANFRLLPDTKIHGRIWDEEGKPIVGVEVSLISADWQNETISDGTIQSLRTCDGKSDKKGEYEIDNVAPGRYLLGVSVINPNPKFPYPRTFFPGIIDVREAEVIVVEDGQKIGPFNFRLGKKLDARTIRGVVLWPDETPVSGASVRLHLPGDYQDQDEAITDEQGRFKLKALKDREYEIKVHWHDDDGVSGATKKSPLGWQSATSEIVEVAAIKEIKKLEIILFNKER